MTKGFEIFDSPQPGPEVRADSSLLLRPREGGLHPESYSHSESNSTVVKQFNILSKFSETIIPLCLVHLPLDVSSLESR